MNFLYIIFDILIPRFITDEVAIIWLNDDKTDMQPICLKDQLLPDDVYDDIVFVKAFNLFGFALFPTLVDDQKNHGKGNE